MHITLAVSMALGAALLPGWVVVAEIPNQTAGTVNIGPANTGGVVTAGIAGFSNSGISAAASATTAQALGSGANYTYVPIPDNLLVTAAWPPKVQGGAIVNPGTGFQAACPPGQTGYYVYDSTGQFVGVVCVAAATTGTPTEVALAELASSRQPWPSLRVGVNPDRGLTGLASWFWLTAYDSA